MNNKTRGFTLIELMIVVAIVALLASIAYPSYKDSVLKGRRAQARTALMELMQQQERYMTQYNCYLQFTNTNGTISATNCDSTTTSSIPLKTFAGDDSSSTPYFLSAKQCSGSAAGTTLDIKSCVLLEATPRQTDADVGVLRISSNGQKSCSGQANSSSKFKLCWP